MKISVKNLRKYLATEMSVHEIAAALTRLGLEVDDVYDVQTKFEKFKVVQVVSVAHHPNADKLRLCEVVDASGQQARIICGASNVREGMKTICAVPGAIVPAGNFVIKKSKIRGELSEGMLCSYAELQLENHSEGIIDLDDDISISASIDEALGLDGGYLDVSITPNRADCMSAYGIARELASAGYGVLKHPESVKIGDLCAFQGSVSVEATEGVHKLFLRTIRGIDNRKHLDFSCGQKCLLGMHSINAVVDIANIISDELGVPFHVYDLDKIHESLRFRMTTAHEKFVDLAGVEHVLPDGVLVSADDRSVVCVLGISGSQSISCDENTRNIMIECACFDNSMIARNGSKLAIKTDARTRFERGVDDQMCEQALNVLSAEIQRICGGEVSEIYKAIDGKRALPVVSLNKHHVQRIIGDVDFEHVKNVLKEYGFKLLQESECCIEAPSYRYDIQIPEDLVEEYMRVVGYDQFPGKSLALNFMPKSSEIKRHYRLHDLRKMLVSYGLYDVISYSFVSQDHAKIFGTNNIEILNPITQHMSIMRPSLLINLLRFSVTASHYGVKDLGLFEIGPVFSAEGRYDSALQRDMLSVVRYGYFNERSWLHEHRHVDVFDIKSDLLYVLEYFSISRYDVTFETGCSELRMDEHYHPYRSVKILWKGMEIGRLGQIHPMLAKSFGCASNMVMLELELEPLLAKKVCKQQIVDKHMQVIQRDFSFIVPQNYYLGDVISRIYHLSHLIVDVNIFDCYNMPDQQRSLGISVCIQPCGINVTDEDLSDLSKDIIKVVENDGGILRDK